MGGAQGLGPGRPSRESARESDYVNYVFIDQPEWCYCLNEFQSKCSHKLYLELKVIPEGYGRYHSPFKY